MATAHVRTHRERGSASDSTRPHASRLSARSAAARIDELRRQIRHHDYLYYVLDRPSISDEAYDRLCEALRRLEAQHPDLVTPDSPTQRVGGKPLAKFAIVRHSAPLLSLESTRDPDVVRRFVDRMHQDDSAASFVLQPKFDGASIELVFERGKLARAITRGNGREGEDVTANVRTIRSIPLVLNDKEMAAPRRVAIRGEILMDLRAFLALNRRLVETGEEPMANPRNAAAGALRQLDPRITASRRLRFVGYEILEMAGASPSTDTDALRALAAWSIPVPELTRRASDADDIVAFHGDVERKRDDLPFEIDGVVVKVDSLEARKALGATAHHPRWAMAFKFAPRAEVTRVEDITVQVGRTGALTPVALLRPVDVGGVTVSRATLHNRAELARRDIRVGDTVRIHRAGDVIPEIVERLAAPHRRRAPFRMPSRCPACHARIVERGPLSYCPNGVSCPAQLSRALVHFASEEGFDITGLGGETAAALVAHGMVRSPADLFTLTAADLLGLEGFAPRSAAKLTEAIAASRRIPLARFLHAIGLPEVGPATARIIAQHFGSLAAVRKASRAELSAVRGIGERTATAIHSALHQRSLSALVDALLNRGVIVDEEPRGTGGPLAGTRFVFTGELARFTRKEAGAMVISLGGEAQPRVTGGTSYVVVGSAPGEKLEEARRRDIPVLSEEKFLAMVRRARKAGAR